MANLNYVSESNNDYSFSGTGSSVSPLTGSRYSYAGGQTVTYTAGITGTLTYNFSLYDMMYAGASAYISINGTNVGGTTLSTPGASLSGTTAITSGDTVVIYFSPGSDTSHMSYLTLTSLYIAYAFCNTNANAFSNIDFKWSCTTTF